MYSPDTTKYLIHLTLQIEGVVDKPDVVGAIFGQTEGLLGEDLDLRDLQRTGRVGRIDVQITTKRGETKGEILISSSLDRAETALLASELLIPGYADSVGGARSRKAYPEVQYNGKDKRVVPRMSEAARLTRNTADANLPCCITVSTEAAKPSDPARSGMLGTRSIPEWGPWT